MLPEQAVTFSGGSAGTDTKAQPVTIAADGSVSRLAGVAPAVVMAHAAGESGTVLLTADQTTPDASASAATSAIVVDHAGRVRTLALESGTGQAGAGDGFLAWSDQQSLWILPDGATAPQLLEHDADGVSLLAAGHTLVWVHGVDNARRMVTVACR